MRKLISIEFDIDAKWSWYLIAKAIFKHLGEMEIKRVDYMQWRILKMTADKNDIILSQNVTQLKSIKELENTISRLGGNRSFDEVKLPVLIAQLKSMSKCPAIIATNQKLFDIASFVNPNTYLIQNGLDLNTWKFKQRKIPTDRPLRVGFVGNIVGPEKRAYKGYDILKEACKKMGLELFEALYKDKQIPHDKMQEQFYSKIDCLVLLTDGEGSSNTMMECMACGIPVITTKMAGFHAEFGIHNKDIIICKKATPKLIIELSNLINDPENFINISIQARKFAEKYHDASKIAEKYAELIKKHFVDNQTDVPKHILTQEAINNAIDYIENNRVIKYKAPVIACKPSNSIKSISTAPKPEKRLSTLVEPPKAIYKKDKITIACVYRSGGDYDESYVRKLYNGVVRNCREPFDFVCLTNEPLNIDGVKVIKLKDNLKGWWSKIELFRPHIFDTEQVVFFDLDTVIVGDITPFCRTKIGFAGLKPWNKRELDNRWLCSGVMAWKNGAFDYIYKNFTIREIQFNRRGDQEYISKQLLMRKFGCDYIQDMFSGVYSFKKEVRVRFPKDTKVVVFHGIPRPRQVADLPFMKEHWK